MMQRAHWIKKSAETLLVLAVFSASAGDRYVFDRISRGSMRLTVGMYLIVTIAGDKGLLVERSVCAA